MSPPRSAGPPSRWVVDPRHLGHCSGRPGAGLGGPAAAESVVDAEVTALLQACTGIPHDVVLVTNEVGWGVVPEYASGRLFRDLLGSGQRLVSAAADRVVPSSRAARSSSVRAHSPR